MLHSILIVGANLKARLLKAETVVNTKLKASPDILVVDPKPSIGISHVKDLEKFLSKKPLDRDKKIVLIPQAELMTLPAQNALLKTLEEPPANSQIILVCPHQHLLLTTLVSRCQLIRLTSKTSLTVKDQQTARRQFGQIAKASLAQRINLASKFAATKETALNLVTHQLYYLRSKLLDQKKPSSKQLILVSKLLKSQSLLRANVNPKLTLENIFFYYPKQAKFAKISQRH